MNRNSISTRRWTRRTFMAALLAPLGYIGYRVAAHNQWMIVTRNGRSFDQGVEPTVSKSEPQLSFFVVGDTGKDTTERAEVIEAMKRHAAWSNPDAGMLLGDNFYEHGVESVDDPRFDSDFELLLDAKSFDMPFYACLGNHDIRGDAEAQVQYTQRSRRWRMPGRYYKTTECAGESTVDILVLDTNVLHEGSPVAQEQLDWIREELSASKADWKVVIGHHPAISGGQHEVSDRIKQTLSGLFAKFGVDLYLSGHDHDLQLLDSGHGWMQVVSGAGSKLRSTSWIEETSFAAATPGFCWLLFDEKQLAISFYSSEERLFTHVVRRGFQDETS